MGIKEELIKSAFAEMVIEELQSVDFNADSIADTLAIKMIGEIQDVLKCGTCKKDDFLIVEEIVCIFEKHNISVGTCHDFS